MKIGIDLGGSHIALGIVTDEGKLIQKIEENIQFDKQKNMKILIRDKIISLINDMIRNMQIPIFVIEEIGIGIPGVVNENIIEKCEKYGIYNWNLAKELEEFYKIPIKVQNDALCAAKAECKYGNLKNTKKSVFICLGTGIGGANIIEDKIFASEYGHMVIEKKGRQCNCERKGCFETYSSMKAFKNGMIDLLKLDPNTSSEELLNILKKEKENKSLDQYVDDYIETLLIGISNIINIMNPEKICIGGSFTYFDDILYKRLLEKYINVSTKFKKPEIVLAKFQNTAGIIGATLF